MTDDTRAAGDIVDRARRRCRLEGERQALASVRQRLDSIRFWTPAAQLSKVVEETVSEIDKLEERLETKAIVAVVGGTGAGKSTLVNALCGKDGTVKEGHDRPTTRNVMALARTPGDANVLVGSFGPDEIAVATDFGFRFHDVVLVDTPDTDSSECSEYSELLDRVLQRADVLVCVFPAQDPKRRDNLVRLAERVSKFKAEHVFLVINQCDRINGQELNEIREDFEQNTRKSWTKTGKVFLVSARSSLQSPNWTDGERPLHDVNEFEALCSAIKELDGSHFADRRIERAQELRREAEEYVRAAIGGCGDWDAIRGKVKAFEGALASALVEQEAGRLVSRTGDLSSLLYKNVARRWHGPIGAYLHIGLFIRSVGSSLRYLNPLNWPGRAIAKLQSAFGKSRTAEEALMADSLSFDWNMVKGAVLEDWPKIGAELVNDFRMSPDLLDGEKAVVFDDLEETLRRHWPQNLGAAIDKMARARSHWFWQVLWHLPLVGMSGWALCEMLSAYWRKSYLPHDFYPHFGVIVLLLWLLPSWWVQSRAGGSGDKIREAMKKELLSSKVNAHMLPVLHDIEMLESIVR